MRIQQLRRWFRDNPGWSAASVIVLLVLIGLTNSPRGMIGQPQRAWLITIALIIVALAAIGSAVNARPAGILIDNRNRVSLSKFQATAWTVLVLSAITTAVALKILAGEANPLGTIAIPIHLLFAMGISATSLVATPVVMSLKADETPAPEAVARTAAKLDLAPGEIQAAGRVFGRSSARLASWADMFRGDETSNAGDADLSKVQQFMITLLLVGLYGAAIWTQFGSNGKLLPELSEEFLWLMGISHASYLVYKAVPHGSGAASQAPADPSFEPVG